MTNFVRSSLVSCDQHSLEVRQLYIGNVGVEMRHQLRTTVHFFASINYLIQFSYFRSLILNIHTLLKVLELRLWVYTLLS